MNRLIIIGASGHGKVVADIARLNGYQEIVFLDRNSTILNCGGYPVIGSDDLAPELEGDLFVAVGNADVRQRLMEKNAGKTFPVLIHPSAVFAKDAEIGRGTVAMACSVVNPGAKIGNGCIINTSSSIDHDCTIKDYAHISVGAHLAGSVTIGEKTWIGVGSVVINNIGICDRCFIGAGSVVIRDIDTSGVYVGIPAKLIKGM